jgi:hypothetical protein
MRFMLMAFALNHYLFSKRKKIQILNFFEAFFKLKTNDLEKIYLKLL